MSILTKQRAAAGQLRVIFQLSNRLMSISASASANATPKTESTDKRSPKHYDIIIGGGGLVGTALAATLARNKTLSDKHVLLLEGAPPFKGFDGSGQYGNRVSAINDNSIQLFKSIGVWEVMEAARVKHVKQMQVWDASSDALIKFQHDHFANDVACIIENDLMLDSMYKLLKDKTIAPNVEIRNGAKIEWVKLPEDTGARHAEIGLQGDENFTCELLIGADGANSLVRKEMNVDVFTIDYERRGLVATLAVEDTGDNSVAWQRFIPNGPVAMLPLSDKLSSLVWSTTAPHAKQLTEMPPQQFVEALNEAFMKEYKKNEIVVKAMSALNTIINRSVQRQYPPRVTGVIDNSRASFPLSMLHASNYVCTGAALIGDAAHRVHPLAGQGVNLGYSDVRFLVDILAEAAYAGARLGDLQYLKKYEQKTLIKNVPIIIGVHSLQRLYSTTFSPVVLLRSLGLQLTDSIPPIKKMFMNRAIG